MPAKKHKVLVTNPSPKGMPDVVVRGGIIQGYIIDPISPDLFEVYFKDKYLGECESESQVKRLIARDGAEAPVLLKNQNGSYTMFQYKRPSKSNPKKKRKSTKKKSSRKKTSSKRKATKKKATKRKATKKKTTKRKATKKKTTKRRNPSKANPKKNTGAKANPKKKRRTKKKVAKKVPKAPLTRGAIEQAVRHKFPW